MPAIFEDARAAARRIKSGDVVMVGGFGGIGSPDLLLQALEAEESTNLTCISTTSGVAEQGLGVLLRQGRIKKLVLCFLSRNPEAVAVYLGGRLDVEFIPMGNLAEAIRAGGAGIPAFFTPTATGTDLAAGKEVRMFGNRSYVLQNALRANVSLIRADCADRLGNLTYRHSERTFGPVMATAADLTIAEVDRVIEPGEVDPEAVVTPHAYVDVVVVRDSAPVSLEAAGRRASTWTETDDRIACRVSKELSDGQIVNLGAGIPSRVKDFLGDKVVYLQTENGILGVGAAPRPGEEDFSLTDAMGGLITLQPGASIVDSVQAFSMIRGGHVDVTVLGAFQVNERGDLANWSLPAAVMIGVGGAMDLAEGAGKVIIAMTHNSPRGDSKLVRECTLPLTGQAVVDTIVTELGVFDVIDGDLTLRELQDGVTLEEVQARTEARFRIGLAGGKP